MQFYDLFFDNCYFRPGYNTTCRLGKKHYTNLEQYIEQSNDFHVMLKLQDVNDTSRIIMARLMSLEYMEYADLSLTEIATNHIARNREDLDAAMCDAYGSKFNCRTSEVTIIGFDVFR